jgi:hypothetical protein
MTGGGGEISCNRIFFKIGVSDAVKFDKHWQYDIFILL